MVDRTRETRPFDQIKSDLKTSWSSGVGSDAVSVSATHPYQVNGDTDVVPGTRRVIAGEARVFYCGYWIKAYDTPADTLSAKKKLIEALTRRLFNHVEHGLNIPGHRLEEARAAYESETCPARRRVKGGMLAGALFNRATDIFTKVVEMQALGVEVQCDNALLYECGQCFQEALALGKMVLHRAGEEGIDELWGEPLKAFTFSVDDFYRSRYIKIALTMRAIDELCSGMCRTVRATPFHDAQTLIVELSEVAKRKCEILRTDSQIFDVWASFVVAGERLGEFQPTMRPSYSADQRRHLRQGIRLLAAGKDLLGHIVRARVPMPKSAREYMERCDLYRSEGEAIGIGAV